MFKKITTVVMGMAASGFAFAGAMGPVCAPGNVTVPCEAQQWEFGVQALYLKSSISNGYMQTNLASPFSTSTLFNYQKIENDWDWGARLEGAYHYGTGNDVTINWLSFKGDNNQSFITSRGTTTRLEANLNLVGQNRLDQVNLELGQLVDASAVKSIRFYGGLQYAHIQYNRSTAETLSVNGTQSTSFLRLADSDYKGFGPVAGIDYAYDVTSAFSVTASGAGSILYGTSRLSTSVADSTGSLVVISVYGKKRAIVPELEAKLGLNYAYNVAQGQFNIQAGYMALNYFKPMQGFTAFTVTEGNYSLYGPYFGLNYVGNM